MTDQERRESIFPSSESEEYYAFLRKLDINAYTLPGPTVIFNAGIAAGLRLAAAGKTSATPLGIDSTSVDARCEDRSEGGHCD